ncbi:MAG: PrsW family intramembrane metalloprotease, partial [Candidatus Dormibacteraeota bacterium]|nr:PrsW family intramembrane metalloprotease [Candidatus Dormibacteraeota bacterium]
GKVHEFRYAFAIAVVILVAFVAAGLIVAALIGAIFLIPVLYLIYLYEAEVYRDEPALVLGVTLIGGLLLGLLVTIVADRILGFALPTSGTAVVGYALIVPIIQLIVMPLPALLLRGRGFEETVDGLVFGVAAGLGFSVAESIVRFSDVIANTGVRTNSASWIFPLISVAVLVPLLHGSTAGAIAASVWRSRKGARARALSTYGIPAALIATLLFYTLGQWLSNTGVGPLIVLIYQAVTIAMLLVYIRFLLHYALLEEARDLGFHPVICFNCHRHVMAAGFCPNCGVALSASPRRGATASTTTKAEGA